MHNSAINAWRGQDPSRTEPIGSLLGTLSTADRGDRELMFATVQSVSHQIPFEILTKILILHIIQFNIEPITHYIYSANTCH